LAGGYTKKRVCVTARNVIERGHATSRRPDMGNTRETEVTLLAFIAGAAFGAGIALLLAPQSGKEVREKLGDVTDGAVQKLKEGAREAKFKMSRKTGADAFSYDGGDSFV
jgi:hypothetical protein